MTLIVGFDAGHRTVPAAEHWLHDLVQQLGRPAGLIACTHLVHQPVPRVAVSLELPQPQLLPKVKGEPVAAAAHRARTGGRAVIYPGVAELVGSVTVADLLATAIEAVTVLGGGVEPPPHAVVDTRGFVRPQWTQGRLTLALSPAPGGRYAPFEVPNPTPCCADHG